ncbi:hypothetical protein SPRG_11088 [Saprolegnia parasitica CBS 223.65]|uniref:F-box domain-containing protein n=1 Tax=Saprolegnia parasitica (strain CBS 223.65) TaxID=695850 RepID=A0A067C3E1_SAPPC|nr:hypothetical protein SPRG_11088 [Saprolegnia parasitica CBS 223.65]KDO23640.1 hypothetical protein SPRG_11088 [Saprolegnia parasitica CBS 223.65]|eukprot:XP_012205623.1 hypothetical protein SPRG_11088 [Saprolegnia parasitica CBS 223.65]
MSGTERPARRPTVALLTVLNLDIAVTAIVQCIPAAKDVNAFLAALPADARTPTLAALQELLRDPVAVVRPKRFGLRRFKRTKEFAELLWPVLQLNELTFAGAALAVDAMSVFAAVTYLHNSYYDATRPSMDSLLRRCTRLTSVNVGSKVSVLDAVTTPAHRVSSLTLAMEDATRDAETATCLMRWLGSGHAQHLEFSCASLAMAPVVMELSVLSSLDVSFEFSGLVALLVGVAPAFTRLTSLRISHHQASASLAVSELLTRFHAVPLLSLRVEGFDHDDTAITPNDQDTTYAKSLS